MEIDDLRDTVIALALVILRQQGKQVRVDEVAQDFGNAVREIAAYRLHEDTQRPQNPAP